MIADQDKFGPKGICYGCGPSNEKGLQIKSQWEGDDYVVRFMPQEHHQAFPGAINGGIIGVVFDCHMNWCAAMQLYGDNPQSDFPSTVTSEFSIKLKRPTPFGMELIVKARPVEVKGNVVKVEAEMFAGEKVTAIGSGTFVAIKPGHPAYHRWD
ncbi:MAG: PaaI family thioesterase [Candidatus Heimdallarchaeota archaeon]|nr:PaaI family thioesterase [Candidatus Heimdallarchaeota archaeon]